MLVYVVPLALCLEPGKCSVNICCHHYYAREQVLLLFLLLDSL